MLDPEELSSIIEGVETVERHSLQGIQEDIHGSTESISTLESDSLTLQSIEADLFQDIRASIQKSSKASIVANSSKEGSTEKESANACSKCGAQLLVDVLKLRKKKPLSFVFPFYFLFFCERQKLQILIT